MDFLSSERRDKGESHGAQIEQTGNRLFIQTQILRMMRLLCLLLCLVAPAAGAQGFINPAPWNKVQGEAIALSIAGDGVVMAAGRNGRLWWWNGGNTSWNPLAGEGTRIAALSGGRYFAVRRDGELAYFDGLHFLPVGLRALDVAIDRNGLPYAIRSDGALVRKLTADSPWETLAVLNGRRLAVGSDDAVWIALADGALVKWQNGQSENLPGTARELAMANDGSVLAIDGQGNVQRWIPFNRVWEPEAAPPGTAAIAIGPQNIPWLATANGSIYTRAIFQQKSVRIELTESQNGITFGKRTMRGSTPASNVRAIRGASFIAVAPPTQTTDTAPIIWIDTLADAASLAIAGRDGSVFALDGGGNIGRWSNTQRKFTAYPGQFAKISVEADGNLWGINALGRVFRRDGSTWHQIVGTASDFSIGLKGQVFATQSTGALFQFNAVTDSLVPVPGILFSVAVAPDGVPWGLLKDGTVVRCPTVNCQRFQTQTASSIAIGPDGSVYIVTLDGELRRLRATLDGWDIIPVLGQKVRAVAVGPRGRPWVVAASGRVYASAFFPRDESTDLIEASTTSTQTTGTGAVTVVDAPASTNGFVFSKNLLFERIAAPPGAIGLSLGPDGTLLMFYMGTTLYKLDNAKKTFSTLSGYPAGGIRHAKVGPDGKLWIISADVDGRIYHQVSGSSYETLQLPIPNPQPPVAGAMNYSINIAPDGSVYAIDTVGTLWRRPAGSTTFSKLISGNYLNAAITRSGDVWVIDNNNIVRQIVNGVAEKRPSTGSGQQAFDIAGGQDGSLYITANFGGGGPAYPGKWNGNSQTFDQVSTHADYVGVAPDGRPTIWLSDDPAYILRAK
jgi:hypothetical protein